MAVETIGTSGEMNGYKDSMRDFVQAHENNTRALLNLAEGKDKNDPRPPYDPTHSDNHWPLMIHHAQKGEKVIGKSLVGLSGRQRDAQEAANKRELAEHLDEKAGWRREPYIKPQVAVLDPATEKAQLLQRNQILEGMLTAQQDMLSKLAARLENLEKGGAAPSAPSGKKD